MEERALYGFLLRYLILVAVILDLRCYFRVQISLPCKLLGIADRFYISSVVRFWTLEEFRT
jgi:hypothetical protein